MKPGFWSEAVRLFLIANGRQDLVDRGDALAQRVAALMTSAMERLQQYIAEGDLYNNRGGESKLDSISSPNMNARVQAIQELEQFVNIRLREEINALQALLTTFDDLQKRNGKLPLSNACEVLATQFASNSNVLSITPCDNHILILTSINPGPGGHGLTLYHHPFVVRHAPRNLRRIASCKVR